MVYNFIVYRNFTIIFHDDSMSQNWSIAMLYVLVSMYPLQKYFLYCVEVARTSYINKSAYCCYVSMCLYVQLHHCCVSVRMSSRKHWPLTVWSHGEKPSSDQTQWRRPLRYGMPWAKPSMDACLAGSSTASTLSWNQTKTTSQGKRRECSQSVLRFATILTGAIKFFQYHHPGEIQL